MTPLLWWISRATITLFFSSPGLAWWRSYSPAPPLDLS
jgi:hypothetical protein